MVLSGHLRSLWFVATSGPDIGFLCACAICCGRFSLSVSRVPTGCWTGYVTFLSVVSRTVSAIHWLMLCTTAINANNRLWGWGWRRFWGCPTHVGSMWVTVTVVTMTVVGAILSPMVVFTTGCAEQLWVTRTQVPALQVCTGSCENIWNRRLCINMAGSLLTRSLVGRLWIFIATLTCGTSCIGYTFLWVLKRNWIVIIDCIRCRCLCTLCLVVGTSRRFLVDGSRPSGRGHKVMSFRPVVCQHPVEQNFY